MIKMTIIEYFFSLLHNIKYYHWQTTSYAEHKATDQLHTLLLPLVDKFVEVYLKDTDRPKGSFTVKVTEHTKESFIRSLKEAIKCLRELEIKKDITSSELLNIRDEIVSEINQTLYLFTFS